MAKKTKYFFNTKTLSYEKYKPSKWILALRGIGVFSLAIILGLIFFFIFNKFIDTPREKALKSDKNELEAELENLSKRIDVFQSEMDKLKDKDANVYRSIYETDPPQPSKELIDIQAKYAELRKLSNNNLLQEIDLKLNELKSKLKLQNTSFDELLIIANNKKDYLAKIPAIQPVSNKQLDRIGSGFGYRTDPFYRTSRFHAGIDFTAPRGVDVYSTADGTIKEIRHEIWGYGQHIIIDHGNGFTTLYAHLSKISVKAGTKVKRGQLIGLVGSTGKSTAPHLHYEVRKDGEPINPVFFFYNDLTNEEYQKIIERADAPSQSFD